MLAQQNALFVIISLYSNKKLPASILMKPLSSTLLSQSSSYLSSLKCSDYIPMLRQRGLLQDATSQELEKHFSSPRSIYVGFDPTAKDLHLGNLMGIVVLRWAQLCGHQPIALIGGATGMIGDPSGKSSERTLQGEKELEENIVGITQTLQRILKCDGLGLKAPIFLNNRDWFRGMDVLQFLRNIGKKFRMGPMLSRESVSARLQSEEGLSFTEFSYQVLQAYDFFHLHAQHGVTVQAGGSDQWGNITAGTDLIGKNSRENRASTSSSSAFGFVWPLLLRKDGKKFGKSEKGAIWLSEHQLPSYEFYQYILQLDDCEALNLLKKLTFIPFEEVDSLQSAAPGTLQKVLAEQLLLFCRDDLALQEALKLTSALKPGKRDHILTSEEIESLRKILPLIKVRKEEVIGAPALSLLLSASLASSKSAARRLVEGGGFYLNGERIKEPGLVIEKRHLVEDRWLLVASGKRDKVLLEVVS